MPKLLSAALMMVALCGECEGGEDPGFGIGAAPACGSPGDPVEITVGGGLPCKGSMGMLVGSVKFGDVAAPGRVPEVMGTTCRISSTVPEGAVTAPIKVILDNGMDLQTSMPFVIPCADAGVDAGTADAGTADAGTANTDPAGDVDLVNGDPALDIVTSQSFVDMGKPWIRVTFNGPWPRTAWYSHYVKIILRLAPATMVATHTNQLHAGAASSMTTGVAASAVTFVEEANGFRVMLNDPNLVFDSYSVECGMIKMMGGTFVQDLSGPHTFERTERAFGP